MGFDITGNSLRKFFRSYVHKLFVKIEFKLRGLELQKVIAFGLLYFGRCLYSNVLWCLHGIKNAPSVQRAGKLTGDITH